MDQKEYKRAFLKYFFEKYQVIILSLDTGIILPSKVITIKLVGVVSQKRKKVNQSATVE